MHWPVCIFVLQCLIKQSHAELHRSVFTNKLIDFSLWHRGKEKIGFWGPAPPLPPLLISHWSVSYVADFPWFVKVCLCVPGVFSPVVDNGPRPWPIAPSSMQVYNCMHGCAIKDKESIGTGMSHARPPSHWREETSPTPQHCGSEYGEITLGVLAASWSLQRPRFGTEAQMNMSARAWKTSEGCS